MWLPSLGSLRWWGQARSLPGSFCACFQLQGQPGQQVLCFCFLFLQEPVHGSASTDRISALSSLAAGPGEDTPKPHYHPTSLRQMKMPASSHGPQQLGSLFVCPFFLVLKRQNLKSLRGPKVFSKFLLRHACRNLREEAVASALHHLGIKSQTQDTFETLSPFSLTEPKSPARIKGAA